MAMNTRKNPGNEGDCPNQDNSSQTPTQQDYEICKV